MIISRSLSNLRMTERLFCGMTFSLKNPMKKRGIHMVSVTRTHQKTMKKRLKKVIGGERRRFKEIWWRDTSTRESHLSHMNEHCGGGGIKRRRTGLMWRGWGEGGRCFEGGGEEWERRR